MKKFCHLEISSRENFAPTFVIFHNHTYIVLKPSIFASHRPQPIPLPWQIGGKEDIYLRKKFDYRVLMEIQVLKFPESKNIKIKIMCQFFCPVSFLHIIGCSLKPKFIRFMHIFLNWLELGGIYLVVVYCPTDEPPFFNI